MTCTVYGLGLALNTPIEALRALPPALRVDVRLLLGSMPPALENRSVANSEQWYRSPEVGINGRPTLRLARVPSLGYYSMSYDDGTTFVIDEAATTVWASWPSSATLEDTAAYLLGPVLGFLLRLRGVTCIHASAVCVGDTAIMLVGRTGSGKSSLAAAFAQMGFAVLADDIAALTASGRHFEVRSRVPANPLMARQRDFAVRFARCAAASHPRLEQALSSSRWQGLPLSKRTAHTELRVPPWGSAS